MRQLLSIPAMVILILALSGCGGTPRGLSFETVELLGLSGTGRLWEDQDPGLVIVADAEDLVDLDELVTKQAYEQLRQVDLDDYFAVAAFSGWRSRGIERFHIERIVRRGKRIILYAKPDNTADILQCVRHITSF